MRNNRIRARWLIALAVGATSLLPAHGDVDAPSASLPVTEVTVFKDGHAFVTHEGVLETTDEGEAVMDYVPVPVLGTFWPYSLEEKASLTGVVAGTRSVSVPQPLGTMHALLEANVGSRATIRDQNGEQFDGEIVSVGEVVLFRVEDTLLALPLNHIRDVRFPKMPRTSVPVGINRNQLTLRFDWGAEEPADEVRVGLMYVQKGIRWIPSYKIDLDGEGNATLRLEAILVNELTDLEDADVHLVVGVPKFAFADAIDPMALGQAVAGALAGLTTRNQVPLMNQMIMSNSSDIVRGIVPVADLGPGIDDQGDQGDLFVFTIPDVTLKKGERMVLPVAEYTVKYQDVYRVVVPPVAPAEARGDFKNIQAARAAQLMASPDVTHAIRLHNTTHQPFTTAPALVLLDGAVLAQSMMTYTPPAAHVDLDTTEAIDVVLTKEDHETKRTANVVTWRGQPYQSVAMKGTLGLTNFLDKPVTVELVRYVWGNVDEATGDATIKQINVLESPSADLGVSWDRIGSFPAWWGHLNGIGRISWTETLDPGARVERTYTWNYFAH